MRGVFFVILACFIWALDTLIRYPLLTSGVFPFTIVFIEHLLLTAIFLPWLIELRAKFWNTKVSNLVYFLLIGVFGSAIGTLAFTKAFTLVNPSLVILLQKLQPLVAIVLARVVLKERINRQFLYWAGVCLMVAEISSAVSKVPSGPALVTTYSASIFSIRNSRPHPSIPYV